MPTAVRTLTLRAFSYPLAGAATTGVQYYAQVPIRYPNATPLQYAPGQYLAGRSLTGRGTLQADNGG